MRFTVLGPLQLLDGSRAVPLGPPRQRAVLAYLLLNANRVVATSTLISALWPGEVPLTARQMLQNSVSALRGVLAGAGGEPPAVLLTHAPGYLLRVDPDLVDLYRFRRLTERGRAERAAGAVQDAARTLRHALTLWRGGALADLVEGGVEWPFVAAIDSERYDVLEALFDAELACGRHQEIVGDVLEAARSQPLRERLTEHAVAALTRCGRAGEAELLLGAKASRPRRLTAVPSGVTSHATSVAAERKHVSVALVITESPRDEPEEVDVAATWSAAVVRQEVERLGGTMGGVVGPMSMALFGVPHTRENDATRAVGAVWSIKETLARHGIGVRAAVASGEALVRGALDSSPAVTGAVVDHCLGLVHATPANGVRVCATTWDLSSRAFSYRAKTPGVWEVDGPCAAEPPTGGEPPLVDREREMAVLVALVGETRPRPQLITVLGEPGIGKTRVVTELARRTGGAVHSTPPFRDEADLAAIRALAAESSPLVVEDVHAASDALLDLIGALADTTTVVVTARPELLSRRPDWGTGRAHAATVTLDPLSDNAIAELATSVPGLRLERGTVDALAARVAGNPLFALTYLRTATDRFSMDDLIAVPYAIHAVIAAQLDALPAPAKSVLHAAAVVGEVVWPGAVATLAEHPKPEEALADLVRRGLLRPTGRTRIDMEYAFRGSLVRDVAYARIPRAARAEKHQVVARWLAAHPAARRDLVEHHRAAARVS